jgi:hypothetical protein
VSISAAGTNEHEIALGIATVGVILVYGTGKRCTARTASSFGAARRTTLRAVRYAQDPDDATILPLRRRLKFRQ